MEAFEGDDASFLSGAEAHVFLLHQHRLTHDLDTARREDRSWIAHAERLQVCQRLKKAFVQIAEFDLCVDALHWFEILRLQYARGVGRETKAEFGNARGIESGSRRLA